MTTIDEFTFENCWSLSTVTGMHCIKTIRKEAFRSCWDLATMEGMHSITTIKQLAFHNCPSLESIDVNATADIHDDAFDDCNTTVNRI